MANGPQNARESVTPQNSFRVILKDARDTSAVVQHCGNCGDFDAMQPYRVPLDALIDIDDRRAT